MKDTITFEDFTKLDIRVGTVLNAERIPKSEKLLKLEVAFGGMGNRIILAGIGKDYNPEGVTGGQVVAILNLAPRKMMGIESHGMLLASHREDGAVTLVRPSSQVADGTEVG